MPDAALPRCPIPAPVPNVGVMATWDTTAGVPRNADVAWDAWPVQDYLAENYRELHAADAAVIDHHCAYYRKLGRDSIGCSLEFGAGPNLYPLMLAAACSRRIDAVDPSVANVAYLRQQLVKGPDASWLPFYERCRKSIADLPPRLIDALSRVRVLCGDARAIPKGTYDLASMHFVAEAATEDAEEFAGFCKSFVEVVCPGGHLIAAFLENMGRYRLGDGPRWPGYRVDTAAIREVFSPLTSDLEVERIGPDPTLPDYDYTGVLFMSGRRAL